MAGQRKYSDILAEILERKHSKCTCPPQYFHSSTNIKKPNMNMECCQFGPNCQFLGPCGSNVPVVCQYNQAKCTCFTQCICGPQTELPVQLLQGPELDQIIDAQTCICGANCYCESDDALLSRNFYGPPPNCDKSRCICDVCLCRPDESNSRLLPSDFRNAIKKEPLMSADERIKQECAEIKQLLVEHEESKRKEQGENVTSDKTNKKQSSQKEVAILEDLAPLDIKEDVQGSIFPSEGQKAPELNLKPLPKESKGSPGTAKSKKKASKKEKTPKRKSKKHISVIKQKLATPSQFTQYSCGCRMPKKKPLHVRYYFSGSTEHYGVKLGHKHCLSKPTGVPKNMGWLWNIEDPSKGIRERKGWPPGFIAKNIKNMITVMKQFEETTDPGVRVTPRSGDEKKFVSRWRGGEGKVGAEPQEEPPLLHIHKKGRTYNITFCPKSSDMDIGPIPIPFSITEKRRDSDSDTSDSTLEFEFHSPKPRLKINRPQIMEPQQDQEDNIPDEKTEQTESLVEPPSIKPPKKKFNKKQSSKTIEGNKNVWEDQQTQMQNIA